MSHEMIKNYVDETNLTKKAKLHNWIRWECKKNRQILQSNKAERVRNQEQSDNSVIRQQLEPWIVQVKLRATY